MNENTQNQQSSIVVSPETDTLVEQEMAGQDADVSFSPLPFGTDTKLQSNAVL